MITFLLSATKQCLQRQQASPTKRRRGQLCYPEGDSRLITVQVRLKQRHHWALNLRKLMANSQTLSMDR